MLAGFGTLLAVMLEGCHGSPRPQAQREVSLEHPSGRSTSSLSEGINGLHQPGNFSAAGRRYHSRWKYRLHLT